jgi:acyl-CoA hydrolase
MKNQKTPKSSETIFTQVVFPNDTNPMGILQGGRLMDWMDIACAVCAQNHSEKISVTACVEEMRFYQGAAIGEVIKIKAKITRAFNTSMEIYVKAESKKVSSKNIKFLSEAFFTFVALDENGKPVSIPSVKPTTKEEKTAFINALKRKGKRK